MKVIGIGKCYCCGQFGRLNDVCGRYICNSCYKEEQKAVNIINNILRRESNEKVSVSRR